MKLATFIGAVVGLGLLIGLGLHTDLPALLRALTMGGWQLAWLLPYRSLFFALYALGWSALLQSADPHRNVAFGYVFWVTSVREAVDRLLPVASVGGSFVAVRLMLLRGLDRTVISASVIIEILLTLVASYVFAAMGLVLLAGFDSAHEESRRVFFALMVSLPVPVVVIALLRYGAVFERMENVIRRISGLQISAAGSARLDREVRLMLRTRGSLSLAGALEFLAIASGSLEIWFAMRLFGRPVGIPEAVILESMTLAVRHVAFFVPAGIGVQEAGLVAFGRVLGIDGEFALAVSMVKRARELGWGIPFLLSWQWIEGRRLARAFH